MNLIVLMGPTAVGKTDLSLRLAKHLGSPIINCDSRQLFRGMKIGTAPPSEAQMQEVQHFFVGTLGLEDYYSAAKYEEDVLKLIEKLTPKHGNLLLSGGSMMYIDAVCNGIDDIPTVDPFVRETLKQRYEQEGLETLKKELKLVDPDYYHIVDQKNPKRIIHALEICYTSGKTYTSFRTKVHKSRPFNIIKIGLRRDREDLFHRINQRVDMMMEQGLLMEAEKFFPQKDLNALNTVGYKELFLYLQGEWNLETAIEKIKKNTRDYAKKQMTWFQRDAEINWFHPSEEKEIINFIENNIKNNKKNN